MDRRGLPRSDDHRHSTRKMGKAMLNVAWYMVSHMAQIQLVSIHRPYQPRSPRSIHVESKKDLTAKPSSTIP